MGGQMQAVNSLTSEGFLEAIAGFVTLPYDYVALTYVPSGNGVGQIQTAVYRDGGATGTIVATLTIAYNSSHNITSITKT